MDNHSQLNRGRSDAPPVGLVALALLLLGGFATALQEAGLLDIVPVAAVPRVERLGIYPTVETLALQLITLAILLAGFRYVSRPSNRRA